MISNKSNYYNFPKKKYLRITLKNSFEWCGEKKINKFSNRIQSSLIINSSGTTSQGKIIEIDVLKLIKASHEIKKFYSLHNRVFLNLMSTSYMGGIFNLYLIPLISNSDIIFFENFNSLDILKLIDHIQNYKIDTLWINPSLVKSIYDLNFKEKKIFRNNIKNIFCGTAYLSKGIKKLFMKRYKIQVLESLGLTETTFLSCEKKNNNFKFMPGYVGEIMDKVSIKIKKNYQLKYGNILVKTPYMFKGYLDEVNSKKIIKQTVF